MNMTDKQFDSLPRYAQEELERLRLNLQEAWNRIAERNSGHRTSPGVILDPYGDQLAEVRPRDTRVSFNPDGDRAASRSYVLNLTRKGDLKVYSSTSQLTIVLRSSNMFEIKGDEG